MNNIQSAILKLAEQSNIAQSSYARLSQEVKAMLGRDVSRQLVRFHIEKLIAKGLLTGSFDGGEVKPAKSSVHTLTYSIPVMGNANCGEALEIADDKIEGYLSVSKKLLSTLSDAQRKRCFAVRAVGNSMNDTKVGSKQVSIDDGDYVIVDREFGASPFNKLMLSVIDGSANIKRVVKDETHQRVVFRSESTQSLADIFLHEEDMQHVTFTGVVVDVIKR